MEIASLTAEEIDKLLTPRQRRPENVPESMPLDQMFNGILQIANQFVPAEAGSILLDDVALKATNFGAPHKNQLVFVSCFGEKASLLVGTRLGADTGIVGKTYLTGEPILSVDARSNADFYSEIDEMTEYRTESILSVPIRIERSTCGVLELINRRDGRSFKLKELELLQIFSRYISTSLQNVLDTARYRELSKRDDLTGLYNDRYFAERLSHEIAGAEAAKAHLSLLFLDLDRFKEVNDVHGHLVGSQTLREVGMLIAATATGGDRTCARYGGDEFVIIVPGATLAEATELAQAMRKRIETEPLVITVGHPGGPLILRGAITASIGVASYRESPFREGKPSKDEFIRLADQAMFRAKTVGRNRVCVAQ